MAIMPKWKTRASGSRFWGPASSTPVIVDGDLPARETDGNFIPHSVVGGKSGEKQAPGWLRSRLRRSSVKVLSRLRLWSSGTSDAKFDQVAVVDTPPSSTALLRVSRERLIHSDATSATASIIDFEKPRSREVIDNSSHNDGNVRSKNPKVVLSPRLAHRLSQKLSIFGPPTVIRRTKAKSRPGISHMDGAHLMMFSNISDDVVQGDTDQSTCLSTVFSRTSCDSSLDGVTASLMSAAPEVLSNDQRPWNLSCQQGRSTQIPQFKIRPSIVTVEAAAATKIFFETHFNTLLSTQDGRAQRLRELHEHLYTLPFTEQERQTAKQAWVIQESDYLRQTRVLKSRSNRFDDKDTVSSAGYETIKVLGRGSFGVVRLVREKTTDEQKLEPGGLQRDARRSGLIPKSECTGNSKVKNSEKQNVYAMKVIRKAEMIQLCQEGHIRAEREFLSSSERSKWIVPLIASFQDTSHLYLIMEYEVGGDFFGLLLRHGVLSERDTIWYVAEMIMCVEEAHRLGWIHRDVKPENFLISASGHLKIADFGLAFDGHWSHNQAYFHNHRYSLLDKLGIEVEGDAKDRSEVGGSSNSLTTCLHQSVNTTGGPKAGEHVLDWRDRNERRRLARSIVGTSQYMAPEIIAGEAYDGRCDYWSIGIILYECLYGMTPFYRENRDDTKRCILHHRTTLDFPQQRFSDLVISYHAIDLIQQLLQIKEFRLSSKKYKMNDCFLGSTLRGTIYANPMGPSNPFYKGQHVYPDDASDIKTHRFFRDIPWTEMLYQPPPYIPDVKGHADSGYLDEEILACTSHVNTSDTKDNLPVSSLDTGSPPENTSSQNSPPITVVCQRTTGGKSIKMDVNGKVPKKKVKESKRPRDKILRDTTVGSTALDVRTKVAFVGYTWRRPKSVKDVLQMKRGRSLFSD